VSKAGKIIGYVFGIFIVVVGLFFLFGVFVLPGLQSWFMFFASLIIFLIGIVVLYLGHRAGRNR
jgi:K+-transporting ATPase A subunit